MQLLPIFSCILGLCLVVSSNQIGDAPEMLLQTVRISPRPRSYFGESGFEYKADVADIPARFARSSRYCRYPTVSDDSEIYCKIYPSRVVCNQTCMFGYTLKDGRQRTMQCNFEEDEWKPIRKFEKCKPFVDCTVSLGPGGKVSCTTHSMKHGSVCDISCQHFEDKDAIPTKTYKCDINGKWHPKLPFCASPGSGLDLVPPPADYNNVYNAMDD